MFAKKNFCAILIAYLDATDKIFVSSTVRSDDFKYVHHYNLIDMCLLRLRFRCRFLLERVKKTTLIALGKRFIAEIIWHLLKNLIFIYNLL